MYRIAYAFSSINVGVAGKSFKFILDYFGQV